MQTQSEFLPSKENQSNFYMRWIWRVLQPSLVLCCWKIWRRVAVGKKWGAVLLSCTRGTSFLSLDSPDVEKRNSAHCEQEWECHTGALHSPMLFSSNNSTWTSSPELQGERFWKTKMSGWKTAALHRKAAFQVFSCNAQTPALRRSGVGCSVWNGAGQLCPARSAGLMPGCQPWAATVLWPGVSAGWLLSAENFVCWKLLWSTPCVKSRGGGWAQISTVAVKMWLTIHLHIQASGLWPRLGSCWQGRATVWQGTSCWGQLQRGEETLPSRSLLSEEKSLEKELFSSLVNVSCLSSWSFILLTALCSHNKKTSGNQGSWDCSSYRILLFIPYVSMAWPSCDGEQKCC